MFGEHIERAKRQKMPAFAGKVARAGRSSPNSQTRAFTFTELLVTAAMISILGVLLVPALSTANDTSKAAVCLANMHQWGMAINMYCEDWNDYFPYESSANPIDTGANLVAWYNVVPRYMNQPRLIDLYYTGHAPKAGIKSIWICPSATNTTVAPTLTSPYFTYSFNLRMDPNGSPQFRRCQCIAPATTILFAENDRDNWATTSGRYAGALHNGGANLVMCDGHAEWAAFQDWCRFGNPGCTNTISADDSSSAGDWRTGVKYHWFPYRNAPT